MMRKLITIIGLLLLISIGSSFASERVFKDRYSSNSEFIQRLSQVYSLITPLYYYKDYTITSIFGDLLDFSNPVGLFLKDGISFSMVWDKLYTYTTTEPMLSSDWSFALSGGYLYNTRVISLTPHPVTDSKKNVSSLDKESLILKDYHGRRIRMKHLGLNGSTGVNITWPKAVVSSMPTPLVPYVGLYPTLGMKVLIKQVFTTEKEMKYSKLLKVPKNAKRALSMKEGESYLLNLKGGIVFAAGFSGYGVSVGTSAMAEGEWSVIVERETASDVFVQFENSKLFNFALFGDVLFASLSASLFKKHQKEFSFIIDLSEPEGRKAYNQLLAGNMLKAQKYARLFKHGVRRGQVIKAKNSSVKSRGHLYTSNFYIPYVIQRKKVSGKVRIIKRETNYNGKKSTTHSGNYVVSRTRMNFENILTELEIFSGSLTVDKSGNSEYSALISAMYERSNANRKSLDRMIITIVRKTGLRSLLRIKVPKKSPKSLKYAALKFSMKIPQKAQALLLELEKKPELRNIFSKLANGFRVSYFKKMKGSIKRDTNYTCRFSSKRFSRSFWWCRWRNRVNTKRAVKKMLKALHEMNRYKHTKGKEKKFIKAYATFGKYMLKTQFTFQSIFQLIRTNGIKVNYQIYGEKISYLNQNFSWKIDKTKNCPLRTLFQK